MHQAFVPVAEVVFVFVRHREHARVIWEILPDHDGRPEVVAEVNHESPSADGPSSRDALVFEDTFEVRGNTRGR